MEPLPSYGQHILNDPVNKLTSSLITTPINNDNLITQRTAQVNQLHTISTALPRRHRLMTPVRQLTTTAVGTLLSFKQLLLPSMFLQSENASTHTVNHWGLHSALLTLAPQAQQSQSFQLAVVAHFTLTSRSTNRPTKYEST